MLMLSLGTNTKIQKNIQARLGYIPSPPGTQPYPYVDLWKRKTQAQIFYVDLS